MRVLNNKRTHSLCVNPNLDSSIFQLDLDLYSKLENLTPDLDSVGKGLY